MGNKRFGLPCTLTSRKHVTSWSSCSRHLLLLHSLLAHRYSVFLKTWGLQAFDGELKIRILLRLAKQSHLPPPDKAINQIPFWSGPFFIKALSDYSFIFAFWAKWHVWIPWRILLCFVPLFCRLVSNVYVHVTWFHFYFEIQYFQFSPPSSILARVHYFGHGGLWLKNAHFISFVCKTEQKNVRKERNPVLLVFIQGLW